MDEADVADRLARVEGLLEQVLREMRERKRRGAKRARAVGERAHALAISDYSPTELQVAAARRALARRRS